MTRFHALPALSRRIRTFAVPCLLVVAGCYRIEEQGDAKTYSYAWWVPAVAALCGLLCLGFGFRAFRRVDKRLGILLWIAGGLLTLCVPLMMLLNKVVVDDRHFEVVDCFLWNLERHDVNYDDVLDARLDVATNRTRSAGEVKKYTLELSMKQGMPQSIVVKNVFKPAWPEVARRLRAHGFKNLPATLPE